MRKKKSGRERRQGKMEGREEKTNRRGNLQEKGQEEVCEGVVY